MRGRYKNSQNNKTGVRFKWSLWGLCIKGFRNPEDFRHKWRCKGHLDCPLSIFFNCCLVYKWKTVRRQMSVRDSQAINSVFAIARLQRELLKPKPSLHSGRTFSGWNGKSKLYLKKLALRIESKSGPAVCWSWKNGLHLAPCDWVQGTTMIWSDDHSPKSRDWLVPHLLLLYTLSSLGSELTENSRLDERSTFNHV